MKLDERLNPLTKTLSSEIKCPLLAFKEFEEKIEKMKVGHKEEILHAISHNSAIDAGLEINSVLRTHMGGMEKDFELSLSEQFQQHKKLLKELIDTESQETQDWRKDIKTQILKLRKKLENQSDKPIYSTSMDDKMDQMFRLMAEMNKNGLQDRDMLLKEIHALRGRETMPLHSTPLDNFPRFHTPIHHQQTRGSPLPHQTHLDTRNEINQPPRVSQEESRPPVVHLQSRPNSFRDNGMNFPPEEAYSSRRHTFREDPVDAAMLKQLRKDFTNVKDWPRFSGEGEYNHYDFIDWVDQTTEEQGIPEQTIHSEAQHCTYRCS